jgi:hypothetical protein
MPLRSHLRAPAPAWRRAGVLAVLVAALGGVATLAFAAPTLPRTSSPRAEEGIRWSKLKPAQREVLKPLEQDWAGIDAQRKLKWLQIADRLPNMPPDERARVQTRMTEWARMTPEQRGQARMRFEEARQLPAEDRRLRWEAYQALSPEEKHQFAARAAAARNPATSGSSAHLAAAPRVTDGAHADLAQPKSNIVPNPAFAVPSRPVAPTVVQAAPGATTTLVTRRPTPPPHQQTGVPKVAATPEFVNRTTLLPKRGPQGAAMRSVPPPDGASAGRH